ncbi:MAG: DUF373 family protein [Thermoplasmata archaeon]|nr:DUF373 family protein [Thermoplasmata archaeon]
MKKLILCVDRDDDVGEKGGMNTPLIGRDEVLRGLMALGLEDPEDSDTNSIMASLKLYDDMKKDGEDVEVAVICGSVHLGIKADEALVTQLETAIAASSAEGVVLVSDGTEDETFYPIISSRAKVLSLRRVFVKQAPDIERTVHIMLKTMREEKIQRKVYIPLALALFVYGICALSGYSSLGLGAIAVTLGGYFIVRAYNLESNVLSFYRDVQSGMATGRISLPFSIIAGVLAIGGIIFGFGAWNTEFAANNTLTPLDSMITFVQFSIWWLVAAAFIYGAGQVMDTYMKERAFTWTFLSYSISLAATGMIVTGALYLIKIFIFYEQNLTVNMDMLWIAFLNLVFGITIAVISGYIHHYIKEHEIAPEQEQAVAEA